MTYPQGVFYQVNLAQSQSPTREFIKGFYKTRALMSEGVNWAGHDAQNVTRLSRTGMIFISSVNGRSHSKDEYSGDEDLVKGLLTLLNVILALDSS